MIRIPKKIIYEIIAQSQRELPNEACGLLTGVGDEILSQYALTNIDQSPEHFSFAPQEQFAVLKAQKRKVKKY